MTQKPDLSQWPTKQQAAEQIGCSSKTVEKLAADGQLHAAKRRQPGSPPIVVYHPDDVARVAEERRKQPNAFVVPRGVSEVGEVLPERFSKPLGELYQSAALALREAFQKPPDKLFMSVKEASALSGLTQAYLQRLIDEQKLPAIRDGNRTRIRRRDLEAL